MTRKLLVLLVLVSVTIAGCSGGQSPATPTAEQTDDPPDEVPGVSNGTLTNATALTTANGAGIVADGAEIRIRQTAPDSEAQSHLTVAADGTSEFSRTVSADGNESGVAYYTNGTGTYVRADRDGETNYRVVERSVRPLDGVNSSLEAVLAAGNFTVATESTDSATVVLTADEFTTSPDSDVLEGATPQDARLVLTRDGAVRNLTVTGQRDGQTVTYTYERNRAAVDTVPAPDWLADVPRTADLQADLSATVVNDSVLRIEHGGGDTVPANTTLQFTANNTAGTVTFDAPLEAGDTRYAYFAAGNESLVLADDRPAADATTSVDSPASVTISTTDGVTLLSVGMGWGSESASGGSTGEAGGSDA
ncbi:MULTISPECIES: DUF7537 family lipoprotein [Haloarcula]|uniref:DUF7537 family lipoprotein n=1 Tax=Haloarcula TaxID=2237 RepID=UPI0023E84E95|nr:hypothetical protein [Halomicroarcula sp. SHR3]